MGQKFDGKDFTLFLGDDEVYAAEQISINIESDRLEGTSRASGDFESAISGAYSATGNVTSMFTDTTVSGKVTGVGLLQAQLNKTKLTAAWRRSDPTNSAIDQFVVADCYVSQGTYTFNRNEVVPANIQLQFTGEIKVEDES